MNKEVIFTEKAPKPIGPYSQAIKIGSWVYISGQIPLNPKNGEIISGGIENQTRLVLENLNYVLAAANAECKDVVKTTIYLKNMNHFPKVNEIYATFFDGDSPPARATVEVSELPKGVEVEIDAVAFVD